MKGRLQLKNGYWYIVIPYKDESGVYKQKWVSTGLKERGNKKAAKALLDKEIEKFSQQLLESNQKIERRVVKSKIDKTNATKLFHKYIYDYAMSKKGSVSEVVLYNYTHTIYNSIKSFFGKRKLRLIDITTEDITEFYDYLRQVKGIKNVTIKQYAHLIRPALRAAYLNKLIPDNPYDLVPPLKKERVVRSYYDKEEIKKLLVAIKGHRYELLFKVAVYYGLRRSEIIGLRWSAIDFNHDTITINHKVLVLNKEIFLSDVLKTKTSYRTLPLLPEIKQDLLLHKDKIEKNKRFYKKDYDKNYTDYVFVEENGRIVLPDTVSRVFKKTLKQNNLKHIRFHDLRHSCASLMLSQGIQLKQIQEWLGHSDFATTADVYSHLDFSSKISSANTIASAIGGGNAASPSKDASLVQQLLQDMHKLGIDTVEEYYAYLKKDNAEYYATNKTPNISNEDMEL